MTGIKICPVCVFDVWMIRNRGKKPWVIACARKCIDRCISIGQLSDCKLKAYITRREAALRTWLTIAKLALMRACKGDPAKSAACRPLQ